MAIIHSMLPKHNGHSYSHSIDLAKQHPHFAVLLEFITTNDQLNPDELWRQFKRNFESPHFQLAQPSENTNERCALIGSIDFVRIEHSCFAHWRCSSRPSTVRIRVKHHRRLFYFFIATIINVFINVDVVEILPRSVCMPTLRIHWR